jgi:glycosyltransferase involved in cell wall biosynthesis
MTRLSIVIPCYNDGDFLDEAVASALAQTLEDVEIIVVDDGSNDPETVRVLAALPSQQVRVLRQENAGVSAARNNGIAHANGEYILPLDADDKLRPSFAQHAVEALDQRSNLGLVGSATQFFGTATMVMRPTRPHPVDWLLANRLPATAVFRRADWEACDGYAEDLSWGEDWHLWVKLVALGREVAVLPEIGLDYRRRVGQVTTRVPWALQERARVRVIRDGIPIMNRFPEDWGESLGAQLNLLQAMRQRRGERLRSRIVASLSRLRSDLYL